MTGTGQAPVIPEGLNLTQTPRPYRPNVPRGIMDMGAFVTDVDGFWPLSTQQSSSACRWTGMHAHLLGTVFLAALFMMFWL
jgi:hypothetical protein